LPIRADKPWVRVRTDQPRRGDRKVVNPITAREKPQSPRDPIRYDADPSSTVRFNCPQAA
jgi:hypothetical protein